jgi:hypothetical protein
MIDSQLGWIEATQFDRGQEVNSEGGRSGVEGSATTSGAFGRNAGSAQLEHGYRVAEFAEAAGSEIAKTQQVVVISVNHIGEHVLPGRSEDADAPIAQPNLTQPYEGGVKFVRDWRRALGRVAGAAARRAKAIEGEVLVAAGMASEDY